MCAVLLECGDEFVDWPGFLELGIIVVVEHFAECPLCPLVVFGVACADFAAPVEGESDFVELLSIAIDVLVSCYGGMLSGLYGVLLGWEAVCVVAHWVEDVEAAEAFVSGEDIGGDVSERVADVEAGAGGVWEHVEDVELWSVRVDVDFVGLVVDPVLLPTLFDLFEVVFLRHVDIGYSCFGIGRKCSIKRWILVNVAGKRGMRGC